MRQTLFYLFALFFIVCGVIILFGFYGQAGAAETEACRPMSATCPPDIHPPPCEYICPDADVR